jgi:hypothetical protein
MTRRRYGGGIADWAFTLTSQNVPVLQPGATITFWSASAGGTQYTDLAGAVDGSGAISTVTAGIGVTAGQIPVFYGPDEITYMWASANSGSRVLLECNDQTSGGAMLAGAQTFTGAKTFGPLSDVNASRLTVYAEATGQVGDLITAYSGTDTGEGSSRQRTFYLNEKGELRVITAKANSVGVRIKGQTSQTAHVLEQTDISNNPISWWEPDGRWRAPNLGHTFTWNILGNITVRTGVHRIYNDTGVTLTLRAVRATVNTAPAGQVIRVDVNKNGTTIFTTQGNRPSIAIAGVTSKVTNMDVTTLADGDYLTFDIDQIGVGTVGADMLVQVLAS